VEYAMIVNQNWLERQQRIAKGEIAEIYEVNTALSSNI
jgi:hypothetical protein